VSNNVLRNVKAGKKAIFNFHIHNTGTEVLSLTPAPPVSIEGDTNIFYLKNNAEFPVDPCNETTFKIEFRPQTVTIYHATIYINNDDLITGNFSFSITASGI
jgi:hypothetical protein